MSDDLPALPDSLQQAKQRFSIACRFKDTDHRITAADILDTEIMDYARAAVAAYREDAERDRRTIEVLIIERDTARATLDLAIKTLAGIHVRLHPADMKVGDTTYRFNDPNANETLRALSERIRAIPDEIAAMDEARGKNADQA